MEDKAKKSSAKPIIIVVIAVLVVGLCVAGYFFLFHQAPKDMSESYQTVTAQTGEVERTLSGDATVKTDSSVSLFVQISQNVSKVLVEEGDVVREGEVLIEYDIASDYSDLERQLSESQLYVSNASLALANIARPVSGNDLISYESSILSAQQQLDTTQGSIESLQNKIYEQKLRTDNLRKMANLYEDDYDDGTIEEEDYDIAKTNYRVAKAALDDLYAQLDTQMVTLESLKQQKEFTEQKLENAQNPLSDPAIAAQYKIQQNLVSVNSLAAQQIEADMSKLSEQTVSPISGNVVSVNVVEGGTASKSTAVIELSNAQQPIVRFEVSEYDAPQLQLGQVCRITSAALPDKTYQGTITKIAAEAIEKEGSTDDEMVVPVEITLESSEELKIGYTVNADIILQEKNDVITLPLQAIMSDGEQKYVYQVQQDYLVKTPVTLGLYGDNSVEITQGLESGATVVANPLDVSEKDIKAS